MRVGCPGLQPIYTLDQGGSVFCVALPRLIRRLPRFTLFIIDPVLDSVHAWLLATRFFTIVSLSTSREKIRAHCCSPHLDSPHLSASRQLQGHRNNTTGLRNTKDLR